MQSPQILIAGIVPKAGTSHRGYRDLKIKMIHMLAKHGAKWFPKDRSEIGEARRSLLKMKPDYTLEFIWIMSKYNASKREDIEELIRTVSIRPLVYQNMERVNDLLKKI